MTETEKSHGLFSKLSGRILILIAVVMWSTSGLFAKAPLWNNWPEGERGPLLAFWRAVFAGLVLLPFVRRPRWTPGLVPMVLVFAAMNVTYLSAMSRTEATNAIWLQYTAPVWVFLISAIWLREQIVTRDWLLLAFGTAGVGTILAFELRGEALAGVVCGLLSGLFYAGVVVSLRQLRHLDLVWLVALNHVIASVLIAPYVLYQGLWPTPVQLVGLAGFGIFQMGLPYVLFAHGLRSIAGHEASGITLLEPLLVPIWVYLAWHQTPTYQPPAWWTLAGGAMILAGLVLRYTEVRRDT